MNILKKDDYYGVMVQFGGQNSVNLAVPLEAEIKRLGLSTKILGTSPDAMDVAEDRDRFSRLLTRLGIPSPANSSAYSEDEARRMARGPTSSADGRWNSSTTRPNSRVTSRRPSG